MYSAPVTSTAGILVCAREGGRLTPTKTLNNEKKTRTRYEEPTCTNGNGTIRELDCHCHLVVTSLVYCKFFWKLKDKHLFDTEFEHNEILAWLQACTMYTQHITPNAQSGNLAFFLGLELGSTPDRRGLFPSMYFHYYSYYGNAGTTSNLPSM